jgi:hypothetical protein
MGSLVYYVVSYGMLCYSVEIKSMIDRQKFAPRPIKSVITRTQVMNPGGDQIVDACASGNFGFLTRRFTKVSSESFPGPKIRMSRAAKRNV